MKELIIEKRKKTRIEDRKYQSISLPIDLYNRIDELSKVSNVPKTEIAIKLLIFALYNTRLK